VAAALGVADAQVGSKLASAVEMGSGDEQGAELGDEDDMGNDDEVAAPLCDADDTINGLKPFKASWNGCLNMLISKVRRNFSPSQPVCRRRLMSIRTCSIGGSCDGAVQGRRS
jgi:hypothetical protein